jgi:thioredoxin 1
MLYTNLYHLENARELERITLQHEKVLVVCGRMGLQCIPVYRIAESLETDFPEIKFCDLEFDNPESKIVCEIPELKIFSSIPIAIYYYKGKVVKASSGIQTKEQIKNNLIEYFQ